MPRLLLAGAYPRRASPPSPRSFPPARSLFTRRPPPSPSSRFRSVLLTTAGIAAGGLLFFYAADSRAGVHRCVYFFTVALFPTASNSPVLSHRWLFLPALQAMTSDDPEKSHRWAIQFLRSGLAPQDTGEDDDVLSFEVCAVFLFLLSFFCISLSQPFVHWSSVFTRHSYGIGNSQIR